MPISTQYDGFKVLIGFNIFQLFSANKRINVIICDYDLLEYVLVRTILI